jgi:hypothetical protein
MPPPLAYTQIGDENAGREIKKSMTANEVRWGNMHPQEAQFFFPLVS